MKIKKEDYVDLHGIINNSATNNIAYVCSECGNDLILDTSYKMKNPFVGGDGYFCGSCQKVYDSSLVHLHKKHKAVTSTIGDISKGNQDLIFEYVSEDKGLGPM